MSPLKEQAQGATNVKGHPNLFHPLGTATPLNLTPQKEKFRGSRSGVSRKT